MELVSAELIELEDLNFFDRSRVGEATSEPASELSLRSGAGRLRREELRFEEVVDLTSAAISSKEGSSALLMPSSRLPSCADDTSHSKAFEKPRFLGVVVLPRAEREREEPPERALFGGPSPGFSGDSVGSSVREIDSLGLDELVALASPILTLLPEAERATMSMDVCESLLEMLSTLGDCGNSRGRMNSYSSMSVTMALVTQVACVNASVGTAAIFSGLAILGPMTTAKLDGFILLVSWYSDISRSRRMSFCNISRRSLGNSWTKFLRSVLALAPFTAGQ